MDVAKYKKLFFQYVKFVIGGGIGLIVNLITTYFFTEVLGMWHMASFALSLGLQIVFLFLYHSRVTFKKGGFFVRFIVIVLIVSGLQWLGVYLLSVIFELHYLISIIIAAGVISIANYFLNRRFVFKKIV